MSGLIMSGLSSSRGSQQRRRSRWRTAAAAAALVVTTATAFITIASSRSSDAASSSASRASLSSTSLSVQGSLLAKPHASRRSLTAVVGAFGGDIGSGPRVVITSPEQYTVTSNPYPLFDVDFGGRVPAFDPLPLLSVRGSVVAGFDVAYDLDAGRILVGVRVKAPQSPAEGGAKASDSNENENGLITVSVSPGAVVDAAGRPCTGASLSLIYAAPKALKADAISFGALALTAAWGAAAAGAAAAGCVAGALAPGAPAGVTGFSVLGLLLWAQRAALTSRVAVPGLSPAARALGGAFSWALGDAPAPAIDDAVARGVSGFSLWSSSSSDSAAALRGSSNKGGSTSAGDAAASAALAASASRAAASLFAPSLSSPPLAGANGFAPALLRVAADGHLLDAQRLPLNVSAAAAGGAGRPLPTGSLGGGNSGAGAFGALPSISTTAAGVTPFIADPRSAASGFAAAPPPPPPPPPPPAMVTGGGGGRGGPKRTPAPTPAAAAAAAAEGEEKEKEAAGSSSKAPPAKSPAASAAAAPSPSAPSPSAAAAAAAEPEKETPPPQTTTPAATPPPTTTPAAATTTPPPTPPSSSAGNRRLLQQQLQQKKSSPSLATAILGKLGDALSAPLTLPSVSPSGAGASTSAFGKAPSGTAKPSSAQGAFLPSTTMSAAPAPAPAAAGATAVLDKHGRPARGVGGANLRPSPEERHQQKHKGAGGAQAAPSSSSTALRISQGSSNNGGSSVMAKSAAPSSSAADEAATSAAADAVRSGGRQIVVTSSGDVPGLDVLAAAEGGSSSSSLTSSLPFLLQGAAALSRVHQLQAAASPAPRAWAGVARFVLWSLVALAAATLAHAAALAAGHRARLRSGGPWRAPAWAAPPRPQLALCAVLAPAASLVGSQAFAAGSLGAVVGGLLLVLGPLVALAGGAALLAGAVLGGKERRCRAAYVISAKEAARLERVEEAAARQKRKKAQGKRGKNKGGGGGVGVGVGVGIGGGAGGAGGPGAFHFGGDDSDEGSFDLEAAMAIAAGFGAGSGGAAGGSGGGNGGGEAAAASASAVEDGGEDGKSKGKQRRNSSSTSAIGRASARFLARLSPSKMGGSKRKISLSLGKDEIDSAAAAAAAATTGTTATATTEKENTGGLSSSSSRSSSSKAAVHPVIGHQGSGGGGGDTEIEDASAAEVAGAPPGPLPPPSSSRGPRSSSSTTNKRRLFFPAAISAPTLPSFPLSEWSRKLESALAGPLLGPLPPSGTWEDPSAPSPGGHFVDRVGCLFDATHGRPKIRRGATFEADEDDGFYNDNLTEDGGGGGGGGGAGKAAAAGNGKPAAAGPLLQRGWLESFRPFRLDAPRREKLAEDAKTALRVGGVLIAVGRVCALAALVGGGRALSTGGVGKWWSSSGSSTTTSSNNAAALLSSSSSSAATRSFFGAPTDGGRALALSQSLTMLALAVLHAIYLRLLKPWRLREDALAELVAAACDAASAAALVALAASTKQLSVRDVWFEDSPPPSYSVPAMSRVAGVSVPGSKTRAVAGAVVVAAQVVSLLCYALTRLRLVRKVIRTSAWPRGPPSVAAACGGSGGKTTGGPTPAQRFANAGAVLLRVVRTDRHWLAVKFASRWASKTSALPPHKRRLACLTAALIPGGGEPVVGGGGMGGGGMGGGGNSNTRGRSSQHQGASSSRRLLGGGRAPSPARSQRGGGGGGAPAFDLAFLTNQNNTNLAGGFAGGIGGGGGGSGDYRSGATSASAVSFSLPGGPRNVEDGGDGDAASAPKPPPPLSSSISTSTAGAPPSPIPLLPPRAAEGPSTTSSRSRARRALLSLGGVLGGASGRGKNKKDEP